MSLDVYLYKPNQHYVYSGELESDMESLLNKLNAVDNISPDSYHQFCNILNSVKEFNVECTDENGWGTYPDTYYSSNITHNLNKMAEAVGIYQHLWRPEELNIKIAEQLIEPLTNGLEELKSNPEKYKEYDAPNGWGLYEHFVPFVEEYLNACIKYPKAIVSTSR